MAVPKVTQVTLQQSTTFHLRYTNFAISNKTKRIL